MAYAIIYDTGPEDDTREEYYETFETPEEAADMWFSGMAIPEHRNARLVLILGPIGDFKRR